MHKKNFFRRMKMPLPELEEYYRRCREDAFWGNMSIRGMKIRKLIHPLLLLAIRVRRLISRQTLQVINDRHTDTGGPLIYAATHIGYSDVEMICNKRKIPFIMLRRLMRPVLCFALFVQRKFIGFRVELMNITKKRNGGSVIFAVTHMGKWDFEIVNEQIPQQFHVVASDFINSYRKISGYFMAANGVIWVDGHNPEDRHNTKEMMKKVISRGSDILIFPEGAWNLHECEIVRDIAYGTAEVALCMGAEIIPVAVEQYSKRFVINMGEILHPADFNCDKELLTQVLRDTLYSGWAKRLRVSGRNLESYAF